MNGIAILLEALPKIGAAILAFVAGLVVCGVLLFIEHARLNEAKAQLESCKTAYAVAMVSVDAQNKAIQELQAKAEQAEARVADANKRAARTVAQANAKALAYATAPVPADCSGAVQWQADQGRAIGAKWGAK